MTTIYLPLTLLLGLGVGGLMTYLIISRAIKSQELKSIRQIRERDREISKFIAKEQERDLVLASMREGVIVLDRSERISTLNGAAADVLGVMIERARGRPLQELVNNPELETFIRRAVKSSEPMEQVITMGSEVDRHIEAYGQELRDSTGRSVGALIVLNDVTQLRRLETVRRDFIANVSHELRTPITSIKGFIETLMDGAIEEPEDRKRFFAIIVRQANRLSAIFDDLLRLSTIERDREQDDFQFDYQALLPIVSSAVEACLTKARDREVHLVIECASDLFAEINAGLVEQGLINLIDNAITYSEPHDTVKVAVNDEGEAMLLSVIDEGCGIDPAHLSRIFERFYRVDKSRSRSAGGTGLGLAIVKHIAQAHGGVAEVQSEFGKGSTFSIRIPCGAMRQVA